MLGVGTVAVATPWQAPREEGLRPMPSDACELPRALDPRLRTDDLYVRAIRVQGGVASLEGETKAFARVVMTGVSLRQLAAGATGPRRQESAVLELNHAASCVAELRRILNEMVRSTPTPVLPAAGTWSWTSLAPSPEDIFVTRLTASGTELALGGGVMPTVRVELAGRPVGALASPVAPLRLQGAVFANDRQVWALVASLRKVVDSALERRRLELYMAAGSQLSATGT